MKLEELNRNEWKAYSKRMEKIHKQYKKNPDDFTVEEINEIPCNIYNDLSFEH